MRRGFVAVLFFAALGFSAQAKNSPAAPFGATRDGSGTETECDHPFRGSEKDHSR
jgi:hypothetical protein